jgi:hypothetical protein
MRDCAMGLELVIDTHESEMCHVSSKFFTGSC